MQCKQCGVDNGVGRLKCRGCGGFLANTDWDATPLLSLTENPVYCGLVSGDECTLVKTFRSLCHQAERGEIDEVGFIAALQTEVTRLEEFVEGIERTLYPEGPPPQELPATEAFLGTFRASFEATVDAANQLAQGLGTGAFDNGLAAIQDAASLLAQAFNGMELSLSQAKKPA